jgi:hypothetical protein
MKFSFKKVLLSLSLLALITGLGWQLFAPGATLAVYNPYEAGPFDNPKDSWRYTKTQEHLWKVAAQDYWGKREGSLLHDAPSAVQYCHPKDVEILYIKGDPIYVARVQEIGYADNIYVHKTGFCRVYINTRYVEGGVTACITFIHEYGHLIYRVHTTTDINSPMYIGFEEHRPGSAEAKHRRWVRNKKNLLAKSICNAMAIHG